VETCRLDGRGPRQRSFFLPGIGEAETREWLDGRWVVTNRLVSRGFTDAPAAGPTTQPSGSTL